MPMHPCWQIKQVNTIDGKHYVDRCNAFGGSGSGGIWITFNSLVAWIAKNELLEFISSKLGSCAYL